MRHTGEPTGKRTIQPLTKPATALVFDFRASSPAIKREERFELEMHAVEEGKVNGIVFWYELHMGSAISPLTS